MMTYFRQCVPLLKPDGTMLLQAITIADQRYAQALGRWTSSTSTSSQATSYSA